MPRAKAETRANGKRLATPQSVDAAIKSICGYDLKVVNPDAKKDEDTRTPEELLDLIGTKGREEAEAVATLHKLTRE